MFDSGSFNSESFSPVSWFGLEDAVAVLQQAGGSGKSYFGEQQKASRRLEEIALQEDEIVLDLIIGAVLYELL